MRFADVFIRRPVAASMLIASLVVLGLFSYRDLGGNRCGCEGAFETCSVLSANLTAPDAVD